MSPMLFQGTNPSLPSHIPIQMAAAPAQGYASSIVSTGPFPTAVIQNTVGRPINPQNIGTHQSSNIYPISSHTIGGQSNQTVFPAPLSSQACVTSGICSTSTGSRIAHSAVFPSLGTGGGIRQTLPTHYYASGNPPQHLALPMSPNLIHMQGKSACSVLYESETGSFLNYFLTSFWFCLHKLEYQLTNHTGLTNFCLETAYSFFGWSIRCMIEGYLLFSA